MSNAKKTLTELEKLFLPGDRVYICGQRSTEGAYDFPHAANLAALNIVPQHRQFCINPLTSTNNNIKIDGSKGSIRALANVAAYRNFLFESDSVPTETIVNLLPELNNAVPIRLAIFSGGKSVHLIVSVADYLNCPSYSYYKAIWTGLADKLNRVLQPITNLTQNFDTSTKDAIRLARLPWADRDGVEQSVIFNGLYIQSEEALSSAVFAQTTIFNTPSTEIRSASEFFNYLKRNSHLQWLRHKIEFPTFWAASTGMYIEIFKLTLWAIDATNVSEAVLSEALQQKVFPTIMATGYDRDLTEGIRNAYKYKSSLNGAQIEQR